MGQAKRRKELGLMPEKTAKPRKKTIRKSDYLDSLVQNGMVAMALAAQMSAKHRLPDFTKEGA